MAEEISSDSDSDDSDDFTFDFNYADVAAYAAKGGGKDLKPIEDAIYNIFDSGMDPLTAIAHMDRGGTAELAKYWIKYCTQDEATARVGGKGVIE